MNDKKNNGNGYVGLGLCSLVLGLVKLAELPSVRPTGRWSLIFGPLYDSFGPSGPAISSIFIGLVLIGIGFFLRSKK
jgi:hypothetical protein